MPVSRTTKDGKVIHFPDNMPPVEIDAAMAKIEGGSAPVVKPPFPSFKESPIGKAYEEFPKRPVVPAAQMLEAANQYLDPGSKPDPNALGVARSVENMSYPKTVAAGLGIAGLTTLGVPGFLLGGILSGVGIYDAYKKYKAALELPDEYEQKAQKAEATTEGVLNVAPFLAPAGYMAARGIKSKLATPTPTAPSTPRPGAMPVTPQAMPPRPTQAPVAPPPAPVATPPPAVPVNPLLAAAEPRPVLPPGGGPEGPGGWPPGGPPGGKPDTGWGGGWPATPEPPPPKPPTPPPVPVEPPPFPPPGGGPVPTTPRDTSWGGAWPQPKLDPLRQTLVDQGLMTLEEAMGAPVNVGATKDRTVKTPKGGLTLAEINESRKAQGLEPLPEPKPPTYEEVAPGDFLPEGVEPRSAAERMTGRKDPATSIKTQGELTPEELAAQQADREKLAAQRPVEPEPTPEGPPTAPKERYVAIKLREQVAKGESQKWGIFDQETGQVTGFSGPKEGAIEQAGRLNKELPARELTPLEIEEGAALDDAVDMRMNEILDLFTSGIGELSGKAKGGLQGIERDYSAVESGWDKTGFGKIPLKRNVAPELETMDYSPGEIARAIKEDAGNPIYLEVKSRVRQKLKEEFGDQIRDYAADIEDTKASAAPLAPDEGDLSFGPGEEGFADITPIWGHKAGKKKKIHDEIKDLENRFDDLNDMEVQRLDDLHREAYKMDPDWYTGGVGPGFERALRDFNIRVTGEKFKRPSTPRRPPTDLEKQRLHDTYSRTEDERVADLTRRLREEYGTDELYEPPADTFLDESERIPRRQDQEAREAREASPKEGLKLFGLEPEPPPRPPGLQRIPGTRGPGSMFREPPEPVSPEPGLPPRRGLRGIEGGLSKRERRILEGEESPGMPPGPDDPEAGFADFGPIWRKGGKKETPPKVYDYYQRMMETLKPYGDKARNRTITPEEEAYVREHIKLWDRVQAGEFSDPEQGLVPAYHAYWSLVNNAPKPELTPPPFSKIRERIEPPKGDPQSPQVDSDELSHFYRTGDLADIDVIQRKLRLGKKLTTRDLELIRRSNELDRQNPDNADLPEGSYAPRPGQPPTKPKSKQPRKLTKEELDEFARTGKFPELREGEEISGVRQDWTEKRLREQGKKTPAEIALEKSDRERKGLDPDLNAEIAARDRLLKRISDEANWIERKGKDKTAEDWQQWRKLDNLRHEIWRRWEAGERGWKDLGIDWKDMDIENLPEKPGHKSLADIEKENKYWETKGREERNKYIAKLNTEIDKLKLKGNLTPDDVRELQNIRDEIQDLQTLSREELRELAGQPKPKPPKPGISDEDRFWQLDDKLREYGLSADEIAEYRELSRKRDEVEVTDYGEFESMDEPPTPKGGWPEEKRPSPMGETDRLARFNELYKKLRRKMLTDEEMREYLEMQDEFGDYPDDAGFADIAPPGKKRHPQKGLFDETEEKIDPAITAEIAGHVVRGEQAVQEKSPETVKGMRSLFDMPEQKSPEPEPKPAPESNPLLEFAKEVEALGQDQKMLSKAEYFDKIMQGEGKGPLSKRELMGIEKKKKKKRQGPDMFSPKEKKLF